MARGRDHDGNIQPGVAGEEGAGEGGLQQNVVLAALAAGQHLAADANADWDNRKLSNEVEHIKSNLKFKDSEIARLEKEIAGIKKQLADAKSQLTKKKQEVEKLTNQVNLLKKELSR